MNSAPLAYWEPGRDEERQLRIFISHRYGKDKDEALYEGVIRALNHNFTVQDISLSASQYMSGPRGGELPKLEVQAEIAARIYTCDVLIAPSRVGAGRSQWVTWEVQLAAIGYGVPILFVNESKAQKLKTSLVSQVDDLGLPYGVSHRDTADIVRGVTELVSARPTWAMRQSEKDQHIRFRGPPQKARDDVMKRFPFQPRLPPASAPPPQAKRGLFGLFG